MQFIVEQQAKFSVDIDRINEAIDGINEAIGKISEAIAKHDNAIVVLLQVSRTLIDHQTTVDSQMGELRAEMKEMARAHRETDERLSAFITYVGKYIGGRNVG